MLKFSLRAAGPTIQSSYLIAGPQELNPGLHQSIAHPEPFQQTSSPDKHPLQSPPVILLTNQPGASPQGGVAFPTDVNLQPEELSFKESQPYAPTPVPPNSPLLIISPTARPSGPAPRPQDIPVSEAIPSQGAFQGGIITPEDESPGASPIVRPSGPAPRPEDIPIPASVPSQDAFQGGIITPEDESPSASPIVRPSGPAPRPQNIPAPSSIPPPDVFQGGITTPEDDRPGNSPIVRPSGPAPRPKVSSPPASVSSPDAFQGGITTPENESPGASPIVRPSGPAPRPEDIPVPASIPSQDAFQGGITTPENESPGASPIVRPSGPAPRPQVISPPASVPSPDAFQGGITTPADQTESSPLVRPSGPRPAPAPQSQITPPSSQTIQQGNPAVPSPVDTAPRYRTLPTPSRQPNISPASKPIVVQDPTKPPIQSVAQPLDVPVDLPIQPPPITPPTRPSSEVAPIGAADGPQVSFIVLESSITDFQLDFDEFGRENLTIEEVVSFRVRNGDLITFTTGVNTLRLEGSEPVQNIPLILGWESEIGEFSVNASAGAEAFNRLAPQPYFKAGAQTSVFGQVIVSGEVEHGPYKFNAETLENEISFLRFRPSVFWQIDEQTTFFGLFQAGFFNDGNQEIQSFSRLERKIGPFSVAANVFTWNFAEDLEAESGYFSPLSFLLYNAEVGWKGQLFDPLTCQFAASIGNQVVNGGQSTGRGLQAKCTASLADNVELDIGYVLTNIISSGSGASNSQIFSGQLRIDF